MVNLRGAIRRYPVKYLPDNGETVRNLLATRTRIVANNYILSGKIIYHRHPLQA